jgi:RHS repeat-associated protein
LLESDGVFDYEYDDEGNRTKRAHIASGDYVEYEWDYRNRLTGVRFKTAAHALTKQVEYEFDVQDRRTVKRVDANGDSTYETTFYYLYEEQDIILVFDGSGSLTNRYLHGPAVDQILADENAIGDVLWPLADNQGTVRDVAEHDALTDTTSIVKHLTYSAFGAITHDTAPTLTFLYAYTGREWDADAQLFYYRARWYDPHTGRFLSRDPLGFAAGDANDLRYVGNSPANFTDPSGLVSYAPKEGIPPEEIVNLLGLPQEMLAGIDPTKMDPVGDAVHFWQLVMFYYDGGRGGYSFVECIYLAQSVLLGEELGFTQFSDAWVSWGGEKGSPALLILLANWSARNSLFHELLEGGGACLGHRLVHEPIADAHEIDGRGCEHML